MEAVIEERGGSALLRLMVRGAYDIQRLRIDIGNRLVATFRAKLGLASDQKGDDDAGVIARLKASYDKITDGIADTARRRNYEYDGIISSRAELLLIENYLELQKREKRMFADLVHELKNHRIYTEFLEGVSGCGPAMAGVIVSEVDIFKAKYDSSIVCYAGLDIVTVWLLDRVKAKQGNLAKAYPTLDLPLELKSIEHEVDGQTVCRVRGGTVVGRFSDVDDDPKNIHENPKATDTRAIAIVQIERDGYVIEATYRMWHLGGRSRRADHLVDVEYKNAKGETATRKSITFNPFLKTKLIGVLGPSFLKVRESPYKEAYYDYKARLENHPKHADKTKAHRHNMAIRYAVKLFIRDLYVAWRTIEGLQVHPSYQEAKLGHVHGARD